MKHGSLFSGIGGFDLAAQWMGWENVFQVEIDPFCQKVLEKNFPLVKRYGDIKQFDGTKYRGAVDIICGGFPCQTYSHSGLREGNEPLAQEMLRVVGEIMPSFVVAENVYGFVTIDNGKSLNSFCTALEDIGYEKPIVFDSSADFTGLQTMERHVWIISKANGIRCKGYEQIKVQDIGQNSRQLQGAGEGICSGRDIRKSRFLRVGERTSIRLDKLGKHRLHAIGNAIPPQVAYEIFKAIEQVKPGTEK